MFYLIHAHVHVHKIRFMLCNEWKWGSWPNFHQNKDNGLIREISWNKLPFHAFSDFMKVLKHLTQIEI